MERKEAQILERFKDHIDEFRFVDSLEFIFEPIMDHDWHPDFVFLLHWKNLRARFIGEILSERSWPTFENKLYILKSFIEHHKNYQPFFLAPYLSEERRKKCKEAGVNFVDLSGNVYLRYKSLFVEREGFPNRFPEKRIGRNPFADKASLILRELLSQKGKLWGVRELAKAGKIDAGFISRMLRDLESKGYVSRLDSKFKLANASHVLADWVNSYDYKKNQEFKYFCLAKSPDEILSKIRSINIPEHVRYALGFHAGASLISSHARYDQVHVYVQDKADIEFFRQALALKVAEEGAGANIIFLLSHYENSVFHDKQKVRGLWVVSDIQLYIDLYNYPLRGLEQAEHLFEKRLKQLVEG